MSAQLNRDYSYSIRKTDYRAFGVNPANISLFSRSPDQGFTIGFLEYEMVMRSDALKKSLFHPKVAYMNSEGQYVQREKIQLRDVLSQPTQLNAETTYIGATWRTKNSGSFAASIKSKWYARTDFNDFANDVLFSGDGFDNYIDTIVQIIVSNLASEGKIDQAEVLGLLETSELRLNVTHEFNLGYSTKLWENSKTTLYGGVAGRYILGQANMALQFNQGNIRGILTDVPFVSEDLGAINLPEKVERGDHKYGHGFGTDIGITLAFDKKVTLGISVADLGFIRWPVYPIYVKDNLVQAVELNGSNNEAFEEAFDELIEDGLFTYGGKANRVEVLPAKIITSMEYQLHERVAIYADLLSPLNASPKNLDRIEVGFGTRLRIVKALAVTTGLHFRDYDKPDMPLYINLIAGKNVKYELGIGTADFISFFAPERNTIPTQMALFRFHF